MINNQQKREIVWYLRFMELENTAALVKATGNLGAKLIDEEDEDEQET